MKINIYSIKDNKIPAFTQVFTAVSDGIACRQMKQLIDRDSEGYNKFANDYQLYKVGTFDSETADVTGDLNFVSEFSTLKDILG